MVPPTMKTDGKYFYIFFVAFMCLHLCASTFAQSIWTVNPNEYEHSMTITCVVLNQSSNYFEQEITIGAFDGDQCVGTTTTNTFFPPINAQSWFFSCLL